MSGEDCFSWSCESSRTLRWREANVALLGSDVVLMEWNRKIKILHMLWVKGGWVGVDCSPDYRRQKLKTFVIFHVFFGRRRVNFRPAASEFTLWLTSQTPDMFLSLLICEVVIFFSFFFHPPQPPHGSAASNLPNWNVLFSAEVTVYPSAAGVLDVEQERHIQHVGWQTENAFSGYCLLYFRALGCSLLE